MALVPAKCTQCGGNIEVDNTHEAGICKFCGTPFVTEKAINNYNTYITNNFAGANINVVNGDIENFITLANLKFEELNYLKAIEYCDKALEIDIQNASIWEIKLKCNVELVISEYNEIKAKDKSSVAGFDSLAYVENAKKIKIINESLKKYQQCQKNKTNLSIYEYLIIKIKEIIHQSYLMLIPLSTKTLVANIATSSEKKYRFENKCDNMYNAVLIRDSFIDEILDTMLQNDIKINNNIVVECINSYIEYKNHCYCELSKEYSISGITFNKSIYEKLVNILNRDEYSSIASWEQIYTSKDQKSNKVSNAGNSSKNNSKGCYIATCVYGSYDCPQVWTLRRYRDYTLDQTWYGRLFIKCYYAISPTLVKMFGKQDWFRKPWKKFLDGMISRLKAKGVADTKYSDKY